MINVVNDFALTTKTKVTRVILSETMVIIVIFKGSSSMNYSHLWRLLGPHHPRSPARFPLALSPWRTVIHLDQQS